jgi:hypothetical protein
VTHTHTYIEGEKENAGSIRNSDSTVIRSAVILKKTRLQPAGPQDENLSMAFSQHSCEKNQLPAGHHASEMIEKKKNGSGRSV